MGSVKIGSVTVTRCLNAQINSYSYFPCFLVPPKRSYASPRLHVVTPQKETIFILATLIASNLYAFLVDKQIA